MQFRRQSASQRPPLRLAAHRGVIITPLSPWFSPSSAVAAFAGPQSHSFQPIDRRRIERGCAGEGGSIRIRPEPNRSWRAIPATMFGLSARLVGVFSGCGEFAISGFLLAFMSWTIAQVLAGCAAYAQAMYPCVIEDDLCERGDIPADASREPAPLLPPTRKSRSGAAVPVVVGYVGRSQAPRVDRGWSASIASLWGKLRSGLERQLARRMAIAELRALDDRSLRDVGLFRCDIERIARHGDRCE